MEAVPNIPSLDKCLELCKNNPACRWTTWDSQHTLCHLNGACYQVLDGELLKHHRYAQRDCGYIGKCVIPLRNLATNYDRVLYPCGVSSPSYNLEKICIEVAFAQIPLFRPGQDQL